MDKKQIRHDCFSRLRSLSAGEKEDASASICNLIRGQDIFRDASVVLAYLAMNNEPDLGPLFSEKKGGTPRTWGFSRMNRCGLIDFHVVNGEEDLHLGSFGFLEPNADLPEVNLEEVDLVLIPGVGFDPHTGARIGRGKGHYDRFLGALLNRASPPPFVGVAFSVQMVPVVTESHDIPMDALVTEDGWREFSGR